MSRKAMIAWSNTMNSLHIEPSEWEKKKKAWSDAGFEYATRRMEEEGIYDLPLEERRGFFGTFFDEYKRDNPKPEFFSGGQVKNTYTGEMVEATTSKDVLLETIHG